MTFPASPAARDYAADSRLALLALLAIPIGALGVGAAWLLLTLIRFFTNLFFFQTLSLADRSASTNTLGLWVIVVPVIGGIVISTAPVRVGTCRAPPSTALASGTATRVRRS